MFCSRRLIPVFFIALVSLGVWQESSYAESTHSPKLRVKARRLGDITLGQKAFTNFSAASTGLVGEHAQIFPVSADGSIPGVVISGVDSKRSILGLAHLKEGDIIEKVNLTQVNSETDLLAAVQELNRQRLVIVDRRDGLASSVAINIK